jgi:hypothetical protein
MCLHFREVYVLWDGAFALARTFNPTNEDAETYQTFVSAAVQSSAILGCPITPKVHTMLRHVEWQMKNIPGGLGDKMEDWVERLHQWGMQQRRRFRTVQNPLVRTMAREKASSRNTHLDVLAQVEATDEGNKRKLLENNEVDILLIKRKRQREEGRIKALEYFEEFSKEEKLTWVEIIFNDVKGGVKRMAFPPQFQRNKTQQASPTMCRGRGMIWNGRQGVTGAAVEDDASSRHGFTFPLLVPAPLFWPRRTKKVMVFKRLE